MALALHGNEISCEFVAKYIKNHNDLLSRLLLSPFSFLIYIQHNLSFALLTYIVDYYIRVYIYILCVF